MPDAFVLIAEKASRLNPLLQRSSNARRAIEARAASRPLFVGGHSCPMPLREPAEMLRP
jgi:hypothetical protein